jgi:hypothetical protein
MRLWNWASAGLTRAAEWLRAWEFWIFALLIFAASRAVVFAGLRFGEFFVLNPEKKFTPLGDAWYFRLLRWDSGWYERIILHGYAVPDAPFGQATAFYPLYPLLSRVISSLLSIGPEAAMLILANAASLAVAILLARLAREELKDDTIALSAVALFWFYPATFFVSAGYTESLCLALMLASLILLRQGHFVLGSLAAGLALATRSTGIVLLPVIAWEMWTQLRNVMPLRFLLPRMALCGMLAASGLLAYMVYLSFTFGDPLIFSKAQQHWYSRTMPERFWAALTFYAYRVTDTYEHVAGKLSFLAGMALMIASWGRLRFSLVMFGFGVLLLPYLTLEITPSMPRFTILCVPAFLVLALLCRNRPVVVALLTGIAGAFLCLGSALFSQHYWMG